MIDFDGILASSPIVFDEIYLNPRPEINVKKMILTAMCEHFDIVRRTLARWLVDASMGLPESIIINHRHYWNESDIVQ